MGINAKQLKEYIIEPTLKEIDLYSEAAVKLLLGTCAQESHMGTYIHQINGPALGIYQCERNTHEDIWENYLEYKQSLSLDIRCICYKFNFNPPTYPLPPYKALIYDLKYATAICRIHYLRIPKPLPAATDIYGLAQYWKTYYNTEEGKGTVEGFMDNYYKYKVDTL